jgi:hypothetical protein
MNELFPVVCGTVVGLCCASIRATRARTALWTVLSVVCGATATLVSGEFRLGPEFLALDTLLVAGTALSVMKLRRMASAILAGER